MGHTWLLRFVKHRVGDERITRVMGKWLKAGILVRGQWIASEQGTPQSAVISPPLTNVYLQYVFGLWTHQRRQRNGQGQSQTFKFVGFTFLRGRSRRGAFLLRRHTRRDRIRAAPREIKGDPRRRRHDSLTDQGRWLHSVVTGYFAYHAVPTNAQAIGAYRQHAIDPWRRLLRRRSQKDRMTWARMDRRAAEWLPPPPVLHPWPEVRVAVACPR